MRRELVAFALESAIAAQLTLFVVFLLSSRRRAPAAYLLAGLSGALATMVAANLLIGAAGWRWLADPVLCLDLLAPPLLYLYVRQIRLHSGPMRMRDLGHLLPALVGVAAWKGGAFASMDAYVILCWGSYLSAATCLFARAYDEYAPATLRHFVFALIVALATVMALRILMALQATAGASFLDGTAYIAVLLTTFIATCQLLFTSLRYPGLLSIPGACVKYAHSKVNAADRETLAHEFTALIRDRKPYLNPTMTLAELAATLGVPARQISRHVNERFGVNVSAYLNQCRVQEAARLLVDAPEKAIKVVMFESGFKSKSIFNREFQRCLGVSPTDFRCQRVTR
jgi:AraC-like DNA-binding protein